MWTLVYLLKRWSDWNQNFQNSMYQWKGYIPEEKEDGVCAFLYCQLNSCSSKEIRESKVAEIMFLKRKYDIDVVGMNENRL